jgi:hypothetical protein
VTARRRASWRGARILGIGVVILSVIHVPLPQADFHNIRHHDEPGQICLYHDHLLRWHPSAESNDDVSLLHWHWFVPSVEPGDQNQGPNDDHHRPGSGPALHAHVGDGLQPDDWRGEPVMHPDSRGRFLDHLALGQSTSCSANASGELTVEPDPGRFFGCSLGPADGLRAARTALFQRWNC